jgi:hypothetical protein
LIGNSTINALANSTLITIANGTSSANVDPISFKTGIFTGNTIAVSVGANVIANATSLYLGNSSINSVHTQAQSTLANSVHSTVITQEKILVGNSTINALANSTLITIANSTSSANVDPISFKTGIFTGNTTALSIGANVIANATSLYIGNSTINTVATQTTTTIANGTHSTIIGISTGRFGNSTANASVSQVLIQAANATVTSNVSVAGFVTGIFTANQTVVSVGANVYANATTIFVGNSTASVAYGNNTIIGSANISVTATNYLNVTGALAVSSNVALSNTLIVTGNTTLSNTLAVTGAATFSNTLSVTGNTNLSDYVTFDTDYAIQVESNTNLGVTTGSLILAYRFPKATFSSVKVTAQVKNTGNTQISEMLIAHDGTDAFVTVFGTVASPGFANNNVNPLATFSANVNGANVDLLINQSVSGSAVKFIAHLIK